MQYTFLVQGYNVSKICVKDFFIFKYLFELCNISTGYDERKDIDIVLDELYEQYISRHFKK